MQRIPHRAFFIAAENDTTFAEKNANNTHIAKHHFSNDIALLSHVSIFIRRIYYSRIYLYLAESIKNRARTD